MRSRRGRATTSGARCAGDGGVGEAADGGLPNLQNAMWDKVMALPAPFAGEPKTIYEADAHAGGARRAIGGARGIEWGNEHLAVVTDSALL